MGIVAIDNVSIKYQRKSYKTLTKGIDTFSASYQSNRGIFRVEGQRAAGANRMLTRHYSYLTTFSLW